MSDQSFPANAPKDGKPVLALAQTNVLLKALGDTEKSDLTALTMRRALHRRLSHVFCTLARGQGRTLHVRNEKQFLLCLPHKILLSPLFIVTVGSLCYFAPHAPALVVRGGLFLLEPKNQVDGIGFAYPSAIYM